MFTDDEKKALNKTDVVDVMKLQGEYSFYWYIEEDNAVKLGLKVWELANGSFYVTQSHHIHAPGQAGPYHSSRGSGASVEEVLRTGVGNITAYGKGAIKQGHAFDEAWFIPNKNY